MEYRQEALRRSAYYQQVASDILWYQEEHRRIEAQKDSPPVVRQVWREAEQVIAGRGRPGLPGIPCQTRAALATVIGQWAAMAITPGGGSAAAAT